MLLPSAWRWHPRALVNTHHHSFASGWGKSTKYMLLRPTSRCSCICAPTLGSPVCPPAFFFAGLKVYDFGYLIKFVIVLAAQWVEGGSGTASDLIFRTVRNQLVRDMQVIELVLALSLDSRQSFWFSLQLIVARSRGIEIFPRPEAVIWTDDPEKNAHCKSQKRIRSGLACHVQNENSSPTPDSQLRNSIPILSGLWPFPFFPFPSFPLQKVREKPYRTVTKR